MRVGDKQDGIYHLGPTWQSPARSDPWQLHFLRSFGHSLGGPLWFLTFLPLRLNGESTFPMAKESHHFPST